jgi:hypothetical protein
MLDTVRNPQGGIKRTEYSWWLGNCLLDCHPPSIPRRGVNFYIIKIGIRRREASGIWGGGCSEELGKDGTTSRRDKVRKKRRDRRKCSGNKEENLESDKGKKFRNLVEYKRGSRHKALYSRRMRRKSGQRGIIEKLKGSGTGKGERREKSE